jgi:sugar phosphate isomerase/epimerase
MRATSHRLDRRSFLAAAAAAMTAGAAHAAPAPFFKRTGLPLGIQLYTLGPDAAKDLDGTLQALSKIGYRTVELAGLLGRTPAQFRASLDKAGLSCPSAHVQPRGGEGALDGDLGKLAADLHTLGAKTAIMPILRIPDRFGAPAAGEGFGAYLQRVGAGMTADDWKANADFLNEKAKGLKAGGVRLGYHNHNFEFAPVGSTTGLEILLANTDPALVTFEMDIGWVAAAGADPQALLTKHKGRFSLMHIKDIKADTKPNFALQMDPAEIGAGKLAWKTLLPAAYAEGVRNFYVEQEPPFTRPRIEAAKISHDYLAGVVA